MYCFFICIFVLLWKLDIFDIQMCERLVSLLLFAIVHFLLEFEDDVFEECFILDFEGIAKTACVGGEWIVRCA